MTCMLKGQKPMPVKTAAYINQKQGSDYEHG